MRPFCKGFSISDVAHAWHTENKLSSVIDGHRLLSRLDIVQVNSTLCSLLHQFAYSQHCIGFFSYCDKPAWVGSGGGNKV